ncbi:hypothetical protein N6H14_28320 [Paenibacillus sp. CC-CFT747]|nr:hypothetical protein N6H14_28320 [Paenibacillus sp. CC-CFT747]
MDAKGEVQKLHQRLGSRRGIHMANVHMLTNLEPFRWGAPSFIQKCVQAAKYRLNANALHFYPLSFWGWPYSPDQTEPRIRQVDRDWLWYAAWLRYAWNPDRDYRAEKEHWVRQLGERHGSPEAAHALLEALEAAGQCAPKLLRRFGITQGNRQTMSLGMTMSQLTNPDRYTPWSALWESHAPQGERLEDYVLKELAGMPHVGETPLDVVDDVERLAGEAERAVKRARTAASKNKAEVDRLVSDIEAIRAMVCSYTYKVRGALLILMYKHTSAGRYSEAEPLEEAVEWIEKAWPATGA